MSPLDLAQQYMDIVYDTGKWEDLRKIFHPDLQFDGPFYSFSTADTYIQIMEENPPVGFQYELIRAYEDDSSACLVHRFFKPGVSTIMAQIFEVEGKKIKRIQLIFDSGAFR